MVGTEFADSISGTEDFLQEGDSYLKVVVNAHKRPEIFTAEMRFNLLTMAIEKHVMAILMSTGKMPHNHAFLDLLEALKWVMPISEDVDQQLRSLDKRESMCSLDMIERDVPDTERLQPIVALGLRVQQAAHEMVSGKANPSFALE